MVQVRLEFEFVFDRLLQLVFQLFEAGLELLGYHFELVVLLLLVGQSHTELILQTADFAHMHFYLLRVLVLPLQYHLLQALQLQLLLGELLDDPIVFESEHLAFFFELFHELGESELLGLQPAVSPLQLPDNCIFGIQLLLFGLHLLLGLSFQTLNLNVMLLCQLFGLLVFGGIVLLAVFELDLQRVELSLVFVYGLLLGESVLLELAIELVVHDLSLHEVIVSQGEGLEKFRLLLLFRLLLEGGVELLEVGICQDDAQQVAVLVVGDLLLYGNQQRIGSVLMAVDGRTWNIGVVWSEWFGVVLLIHNLSIIFYYNCYPSQQPSPPSIPIPTPTPTQHYLPIILVLSKAGPNYYRLWISQIRYMKTQLAVLLLCCLTHLRAQANYKKVIHNYDPEAKCLDGSPALLYVHQGTEPNKILIFFEGGGLCGEETLASTIESCYERSKTLLGSSKYWPEELTPDLAQGYLSTNPATSRFANWTKFVFGYCDGSLHQGYTAQPIRYKDAELYFRGAAITRSHFDWINAHYNLKTADRIILTGGSAGGIAVNLWSNYLKSYVADSQSVYPIADSGVFMDFRTHLGDLKLQKQMSNLYQVANKQESTPLPECNRINPGSEWRCLFIENGYPEIKGRFMVINSEYDSWSIPNILGYGCLSKGHSGMTLSNCTQPQMAYIQQYRDFYRDTMGRFLSANPELSIWSIACSNHVYACFDAFYNYQQQEIPSSVGKTVKAAVEQYVLEGRRVVLYDQEGWPSNSGCAN